MMLKTLNIMLNTFIIITKTFIIITKTNNNWGYLLKNKNK